MRPLGTVVKIGWGPQPLAFSLDPLAKAATLQGSFSYTYATWERVLQLMATGQLNLDPMIGGIYGLDEWEGLPCHASGQQHQIRAGIRVRGSPKAEGRALWNRSFKSRWI